MTRWEVTNARYNIHSEGVVDLLNNGNAILAGVPYIAAVQYVLANATDSDAYQEEGLNVIDVAELRRDAEYVDTETRNRGSHEVLS